MNKRIFTAITLTLFLVYAYVPLATVNGSETTSPYSVHTIDGSYRVRGYGKYRVTIYYPADRSERNPAVIFAHGLLACKSWYTWIGEDLASEGYIVLMFTVPKRASSDVYQWAEGIKGGIRYLSRHNRCWFSPLFRRVDTKRMAVMGHSMGAMASIIVAAEDQRVKAAIALAPVCLTDVETGSEIIDSVIEGIDWDAIVSAGEEITYPIQIQVGTKDKLAWDSSLAPENAEKYFVESRGDELVLTEGANHVGYMDNVTLLSTILPLLDLFLDLPGEIQQSILSNLDLLLGGDGDGDEQTLIDLAVQILLDSPAEIPVTEQHQWAVGNATNWLATHLCSP